MKGVTMRKIDWSFRGSSTEVARGGRGLSLTSRKLDDFNV